MQNFRTGLLLSAIPFQVHEPHIFSNKTNIRYNDNVIQIIIAGGREREKKGGIEGLRTKNRIGWQLAPTYHDCCTEKKDCKILCK
jgi:hypothetical protein